jgi:hypothetical protein
MPRVKIPPPYQGPTQGQDTIDVSGSTVRECIEAVVSQAARRRRPRLVARE